MTSIAAAVATVALTLVAPPAASEPRGDLQISAFLKFAEASAKANAGAPPQIDSHPSLAEEAPHMVPVLQPPAASAAPSQPGLPEDAPHIVPVVPQGPGATYTRAPVE